MNQKTLLLLLSLAPFLHLSAQVSDPELAEKLKSVMMLFDKNQQDLKDEISALDEFNTSLTEANFKLYQDLQAAQRRILALESENLLLRGKISEVAIKEVEAASLTPTPIANETREVISPPRQNAQQNARTQERTENNEIPALININTATKEELASLPVIDEAMAIQIISNRPYNAIDDLIINTGFGPMKLRRITPFITAE